MNDFIIPAKTERTGRKNGQILKDSGETQFVFQEVKMQLQHGRNPYLRSCSREEIGQDRIKEDKSSKGVEDTDQSQGCGKLPWIHKFLPMIYPKLQLYCKTTE